jgi:hypothetical protein
MIHGSMSDLPIAQGNGQDGQGPVKHESDKVHDGHGSHESHESHMGHAGHESHMGHEGHEGHDDD